MYAASACTGRERAADSDGYAQRTTAAVLRWTPVHWHRCCDAWRHGIGGSGGRCIDGATWENDVTEKNRFPKGEPWPMQDVRQLIGAIDEATALLLASDDKSANVDKAFHLLTRARSKVRTGGWH